MVELTEEAAVEIKRIMRDKRLPETGGLRMAIKGGGCAGFEYVLDLAKAPDEFDEQLESHGVPIFVDKKSLLYVGGTQIDFAQGGLLGGQFVFQNPNATGTCGCGTSFSA